MYMLHPNEVAVIVLNYNNAIDTINCLRAIYDLVISPGAIIIVDNASTDNSVKEIKTKLMEWNIPYTTEYKKENKKIYIKTIFCMLTENNGYAAGNNAGIRVVKNFTTCTAYWLLNNDTIPKKNSLNALCERYNQCDQDAIVGSTIVYYSNPAKVQCAAGDRVFVWLGITRAICEDRSLYSVLSLPESKVERQLGHISGASLLVSKNIICKIGKLREDFFLYLEDTDFCIRARKKSIPLLWAKKSIVLHKEGGTTGAGTNTILHRPKWVDFLMLRNRARLVRNYFPFALPLLCISYFVVICRRLIRKQPNRVLLVCKALWQGLVGKMGKISSY